MPRFDPQNWATLEFHHTLNIIAWKANFDITDKHENISLPLLKNFNGPYIAVGVSPNYSYPPLSRIWIG